MFWDASAIVPLAFEEPRSAELLTLAETEGAAWVWWGTSVECAAAAYRKQREARTDRAAVKRGLQLLHEVLADAAVVVPTDAVRRRAEHLVAAYPLRAGDAVQLAAALAWCDEHHGMSRSSVSIGGFATRRVRTVSRFCPKILNRNRARRNRCRRHAGPAPAPRAPT